MQQVIQSVAEEGDKSLHLWSVLLLCIAQKGLGLSRSLTGVMTDYGIVWREWSQAEGSTVEAVKV